MGCTEEIVFVMQYTGICWLVDISIYSAALILDNLERGKIPEFCQVQIVYISNIPYLLASVDEEI